MEERAQKARAIVDRIEQLLKQIDRLKESRGVIDLHIPYGTIRIDIKPAEDRADDIFATRAVAEIYNAYISIALIEIRRLEKELAEL